MSKPKFLYEIDGKLVAHSDHGRSIVVQQGHPLSGNPDSYIYLNRDDAGQLAAALNQWLADTAP